MSKTNKHIEIVSSSIACLSSMSEPSRNAIQKTLSKHYSAVRVSLIDSVSDLNDLVARKPDLVFLGMKYLPSDSNDSKIWLNKYLESKGIPCTGSPATAHKLELSKPLAKQHVAQAGLTTSPFYVAIQNKQQDIRKLQLNFPLFVKPANRGGGLGIDEFSVAHNFNQLESKIEAIATRHQSDSLIEEYLAGREFSVAILKNSETSVYTAMPIELIAAPNKNGVCMLGSEMKESNQERVELVADPKIRKAVMILALDVFKALGARDYGRIDIRMDAEGVPHFLEANLIPSLISGYGSFPKACLLNDGIDYEEMLLRIVKLGFAREGKHLPLPFTQREERSSRLNPVGQVLKA